MRERIEMGEIDLELVRTPSMATHRLTKHGGVEVLDIGKFFMGVTIG